MNTRFPFKIRYSIDPKDGQVTREFAVAAWVDTNADGFIIESAPHSKIMGPLLGYFVDESRNRIKVILIHQRGKVVHTFSTRAEYAPTIEEKFGPEMQQSKVLPGLYWGGE